MSHRTTFTCDACGKELEADMPHYDFGNGPHAASISPLGAYGARVFLDVCDDACLLKALQDGVPRLRQMLDERVNNAVCPGL